MAELAGKKGQKLRIRIYGGTAMSLAYNTRDATQDVDASAFPQPLASQLAAIVAKEQNLPENWLNDDMKLFFSIHPEHRPFNNHGIPNLEIQLPTAAYLLALKLQSGRRGTQHRTGDASDIKFLMKKTGIRHVEEAETILNRFFPRDTLPNRTIAIINEYLNETGIQTENPQEEIQNRKTDPQPPRI